jgi:N-acyl-D-amino-acid deacylase
MLIQNGTIIDGTKKERFRGDIRIEGDKIQAIGALEARKGERVIDARNYFVTPGFVDITNHSDTYFSIFERPGLRSLLSQGITTIVGGNCGASLAPIVSPHAIKAIQKWQDVASFNLNWQGTGEFLEELRGHKIALNFATLTGHGTLRRGVVGDNFAALDENAIRKMEYLLEKSLEEGSFGLSTGLAYSHEKIAAPRELERLLKVLKRKDGLYTTHLRDEGMDVGTSVNETIAFVRSAEVPCHISHFKAVGKKAWGEFKRALDMVERAKESGVWISFDIYPYTQTATVLYLLLPDWATEGGKGTVLQRLREEESRRKIYEELSGQEEELGKIIIASGDIDKVFIGKTLSSIAKNQGMTVPQVLLDLILAAEDRVIGFMPTLDEANVKIGIESKAGIIASDGAGYGISDRKKGVLVHPRSFGAFPRFLAQYIRDQGMMSWESAIHKITSFPAERVGLQKRGRIEKGYFADIVIFDPEKLEDKATFKDPFQYCEGIRAVFVNGGMAYREGKFQKKKWGRVLVR